MIDAAYLANADGKTVETSHVLDALRRITPTIKMRAEEIAAIRALRGKGFYPANEYEAEKTTKATRLVAT